MGVGILSRTSMTLHIILGGVTFVCRVGWALTSAMLTWEAVEAVNQKLAVKEQFDPLWWYTGKYMRLRREYRRLCPEGKLLRRERAFGIACFAFFLATAWVTGILSAFFRPPGFQSGR